MYKISMRKHPKVKKRYHKNPRNILAYSNIQVTSEQKTNKKRSEKGAKTKRYITSETHLFFPNLGELCPAT